MENVILESQLREEKGKSRVKLLRRQGFIPAVVYAAGKDSLSVKLSRHDFLQFIHHHHLETTVINLKVKDKKKSWTVLVKDVQYHPVKENVIHIDFQEISLTSEIKLNVKIVPKGEPVGVKQDGGMLNHILWELEIECLPTQIPAEITVDVALLKIGDAIHVQDLILPAGVKAVNPPDSLVFSLEPPAKEEEPEAGVLAEEEQPSGPEVIKEKKEAPEGGAEEGSSEK